MIQSSLTRRVVLFYVTGAETTAKFMVSATEYIGYLATSNDFTTEWPLSVTQNPQSEIPDFRNQAYLSGLPRLLLPGRHDRNIAVQAPVLGLELPVRALQEKVVSRR